MQQKRQEAAIQASKLRLEAEAANRAAILRRRVNELKLQALQRLNAGQPVFAYRSVYLPIDSVIMDEPINKHFDTSSLFLLGIQGWEAVQVAPRTLGVGLKNESIGSTIGTTWGGASGGNVAGIHVILRKSLTLADVTIDTDDELALIMQEQLTVR